MGKRCTIRADGVIGVDGVDGRDGDDGTVLGAHGTNGGFATEPTPGEDGHDVVLTLSTSNTGGDDAVTADDAKLVHLCATSPRTGTLLDDVFSLEHVPTIRWSAKGGYGGNGANGGRGGKGATGAPGMDARSLDLPGTDGQPGGHGGNGGEGSSGANGGNGGNIKIEVLEKDSFLLMLLDPSQFQESALSGGKGGSRGAHGPGAEGAPGGTGGRSMVTSNDAGKKVTIPGGDCGSDGANGLTPLWNLQDGTDGNPGTFSIAFKDQQQSQGCFEGRYNVALVNLEYEGKFPMADPSECEFGDVVSIRNIKVRNNGLMPIPKYQEIHFDVKNTENPNVVPLISKRDAFLPAGTSCEPGGYAFSEGELRFFAGYPGEVDDEYDFDSLQLEIRFFLRAFQYGPISSRGNERKSDFVMEYTGFHAGDGSTVSLSFSPGITTSATARAREEGIPVTLRYPIENRDGLKAARSLFAGETTVVSFNIQNASANTLGGVDVKSLDARPRRVALRYFYLRSKLYDLPSDSVSCRLHSLNDSGKLINLVDNPTLLDVPSIAPGEAHDFKIDLTFGHEVIPYSRMALVVDLFVESLPIPKGIMIDQENADPDQSTPELSVVQRRKLEFICEPAYEQREDATFVLVTSYATTRAQFEAWTNVVFKGTLNVDFEVFSVSRYGTLDPTFVVGTGETLREAFRNKVVVILTEEFKENVRDTETISPLQLFPNGCMQQSSGYDPSTRFLIVGVDQTHVTSLLKMYLVAPIGETGDFPDRASFEKYLQQYINERAARGHERLDLPLRLDTIHVLMTCDNDRKAASELLKIGSSLANFLKDKDPLNQYTIECFDKVFETDKSGFMTRKCASLQVRRGFCRSLNSAVCVIGKYCAEPKQIMSQGIIMAVAETMTNAMRVEFLANAIRSEMPDEVLTAFKFACVSELIRECSIFLKAEMKISEDLDHSFPSVQALIESVELLSLLRDAKTSTHLMTRVSCVLSDLLARLELVANSKDLRPRFSLDRLSKRKVTSNDTKPLFGLEIVSKKKIAVDAMSEMVGRLRLLWKSAISDPQIEQIKNTIKAEIKDFLHEDAGKTSVNYRADKRWMQGLNYVHSAENSSAFGIANPCKRLIELDIDEEVNNYKIQAPATRILSSWKIASLRDEMLSRRDRCIQLAKIVQLNRTFAVRTSEDVLTFVNNSETNAFAFLHTTETYASESLHTR